MIPTNDYIFKRIFGRIGNENITKNLLESVLETKVSINTPAIIDAYMANSGLYCFNITIIITAIKAIPIILIISIFFPLQIKHCSYSCK